MGEAGRDWATLASEINEASVCVCVCVCVCVGDLGLGSHAEGPDGLCLVGGQRRVKLHVPRLQHPHLPAAGTRSPPMGPGGPGTGRLDPARAALATGRLAALATLVSVGAAALGVEALDRRPARPRHPRHTAEAGGGSARR